MKKIAIFMILLSVSTIIMGIGYAAIDNVTLELSGNTSVKKIDNIRITKVEYKSDLLANKEESKINHFNKTTINSKIVLGDDIDSTISYEVTLRNDTDSTYKYVGAVNDNSKEFYDNDNIGYEVSGIDNNELLQPDTEKVVTLTFKYKSEPIDNQILNSYINIKFIKIYNIEYVNIDSNDLTEYPYDTKGIKYTPVEYLESTGTQYINTLYYPDENTNAKYKVKLLTIKQYGPHLLSSKNYYFPFIRTYGNLIMSSRNTSELIISDFIKNSENIYEFEAWNNNKIIVNGQEFDASSYNVGKDTVSLYLFTYGGQPTNEAFLSNVRFYYCKIYDEDTLVRDYIPVIDSNSRPCLFDKVSRECYYNQGTGEFLYG